MTKETFVTAKPLFVCRTGSKLFCNSTKDNDFVVVTEDSCEFRYLKHNGDCYFCYSRQCFEKMLKFQMDSFFNSHAIVALFAKGENLIYGQNPVENYNWWDYRRQAVANILDWGNNGFFLPTVGAQQEMCVKSTVWAFATYFVLQNRQACFTPKQKHVLQLCHDNRLPVEFRDKLKTALLQLKESFTLEDALTANLPEEHALSTQQMQPTFADTDCCGKLDAN